MTETILEDETKVKDILKNNLRFDRIYFVDKNKKDDLWFAKAYYTDEVNLDKYLDNQCKYKCTADNDNLRRTLTVYVDSNDEHLTTLNNFFKPNC